MAVKVDKDFLLKHRFWILMGVFVILALVPPFLLATSVSDTVDKKRAEYDAAKKNVEGITSPKNQRWVEAARTKDKFVADKKMEMHEKAWRSQAGMMTYPESLASIMQPKYFGDPIEYHDLDKYQREYGTQLKDMIVEVQPLLPQDGYENGVVQFLGDNVEGVLKLNVAFNQPPPSKEDFWLAQEDLWMKRELLRVIRDANDSVARFHANDEEPPAPEVKKSDPATEAKPPVAAETKPATGADGKPVEVAAPAAPKPAPKPVAKKIDLNHRVFHNQHWELDLTLKPGPNAKNFSVGGTIKNIGHKRRPLDSVIFKVLLTQGANAAGIPLVVSREPLAVGESWTIPAKEFTAELVAFEGLYGVEEILTWKTAPVKRIDAVELDYHSSRMASRTLKPPRWYTPPADATPAAGGGTEGATMPGGIEGKRGAMGGFSGPGAGAGSAAGPVTKSGLNLNRYIDANEQVRHMPVGMVVIADDEHLAEVLSAFTNSRLRIQVTQCHWQVSREKMAPHLDDSSSGAPTGPGRGNVPGGLGGRLPGAGKGMGLGGDEPRNPGRGNGIYRGGMAGKAGGMGAAMGGMGGTMAGKQLPGRAPGMSGMAGMSGPGGNPFMAGAGTDDDGEENLNLLELAVYGVASIYERYPPKPPEAAADATAGQPPATPKP